MPDRREVCYAGDFICIINYVCDAGDFINKAREIFLMQEILYA